MAVKASAEAIREMKKTISDTIKDIEKISQGIRTGVSASNNWDDEKAAQFNMLMQKTARLVEKPTDTLKKAIPKLEKLAASLDQYKKVRF